MGRCVRCKIDQKPKNDNLMQPSDMNKHAHSITHNPNGLRFTFGFKTKINEFDCAVKTVVCLWMKNIPVHNVSKFLFFMKCLSKRDGANFYLFTITNFNWILLHFTQILSGVLRLWRRSRFFYMLGFCYAAPCIICTSSIP